jgi:hypothetical protein
VVTTFKTWVLQVILALGGDRHRQQGQGNESKEEEQNSFHLSPLSMHIRKQFQGPMIANNWQNYIIHHGNRDKGASRRQSQEHLRKVAVYHPGQNDGPEVLDLGRFATFFLQSSLVAT